MSISNPLLVSIITIVYNGEKSLESTIQSVISQSYSNIEYIIIDGGSSDGTLDIINKYKYFISKSISEKDAGISDAFNKGINLASGEIIGFINADDWYVSDAIQTIVDNYTDPNEILCGNVKLFNSETNFKVKQSSISKLKHQMTIWHPGMFCSKHLYDKIGNYNLNYKVLMDYEFVIRAYLHKVNFKFIDSVVANMRFGGISNQLIFKSMLECLYIKNIYFGKKIWHYFEFFYLYVYYYVITSLKKIIYQWL